MGWRDRRVEEGESVWEGSRGGENAAKRHGPDFFSSGGAAAPVAWHGAKHTGFSFVIEGRQSNQSGGWKEKESEELFLISRLRKT